MLVLDRRIEEGFWIDGRIFVKVISVGRRRAKIGIEAPLDVEILREERRERRAVNGTNSQTSIERPA